MQYYVKLFYNFTIFCLYFNQDHLIKVKTENLAGEEELSIVGHVELRSESHKFTVDGIPLSLCLLYGSYPTQVFNNHTSSTCHFQKKEPTRDISKAFKTYDSNNKTSECLKSVKINVVGWEILKSKL